jgi:hypothetical protein
MRTDLEKALSIAVFHREGMEALLAIEELKDVVDFMDDDEDLARAIAISRQDQGGGSLDFIASLREQSVIASKEATDKVQDWIQSHDPTLISRPTDDAVRKAREALRDAISNDPNEDKNNTFNDWKEANEQAMCVLVSEWQHWDNTESPLVSFPAKICLKAMEVAVELSNALSTFSQQARKSLKLIQEEKAMLSTIKDVPTEQINTLNCIEADYDACYDDFYDAESAWKKCIKKSRRKSQGDLAEKEQEFEAVRIRLQRIQRSRESARASLVELAANHYPELVRRKDIQLGALSGEEAGILTMGRLIEQ